MSQEQRSRKQIRMDIADTSDFLEIGRLFRSIAMWHCDRNLIDGATSTTQFIKLGSEMAELGEHILKGQDIKDDIGDMLVVMTNICVREKISIVDCLRQAYNDIKDRKGIMHGGVFVKSTDQDYESLCCLYGVPI